MMWKLALELTPLALLVAGTGLCAYIFYSLKRELAGLYRTLEVQKRETAELETRLQQQITELRSGVKEAEERANMFVPPPPLKSGLNLNKRSQVLRMARHGESMENIAAALSLPRKEVELLLKVQQIVLSGAEATS